MVGFWTLVKLLYFIESRAVAGCFFGLATVDGGDPKTGFMSCSKICFGFYFEWVEDVAAVGFITIDRFDLVVRLLFLTLLEC